MVIRFRKIILLILIIIVIFISYNYFLSNKNKTKVLLIGLDGADWKVITPLINQGKLPNIKRLMDNGCWGNFESFWPLCSEVIWTSIATGKTPDKHGITDRLMKDPDTGELVPTTSNLRKVKAIWNILSKHKKKVGIIGYRVSWPAEEVNGVMICDRTNINQYLSNDYSYPPFVDLCSKSEFENFSKVKNSILSCIDREKLPYFAHYIYSVEPQDNFMSNFAKYLLKKDNFDFLSLYIFGTDVLSHYFWKYLFPEGFEVDEEGKQRYEDIINDYYIYCDSVIGDLLKEVSEDTTVIIVSDHGFSARYHSVYLLRMDSFLEISGLSEIKMNSKTINLKSEPEHMTKYKKNIKIIGDLSKEEFNGVKQKAKNILGKTKVKETGHYIFKIIGDTKNGFIIEADARYLNKNFEHHILIQDKEYKILDFLFPSPLCGRHDKLGVIIISRKNICQNKAITTATIYDITPTVLYLMGLPLGKDMKGKVLVEAIDDKFLQKYPIRYIDTYETDEKEKIQKPIRSPEDEKKIKEMMRSLGYIN